MRITCGHNHGWRRPVRRECRCCGDLAGFPVYHGAAWRRVSHLRSVLARRSHIEDPEGEERQRECGVAHRIEEAARGERVAAVVPVKSTPGFDG